MARTRRPDKIKLTHPETIRFNKAVKDLVRRAEVYAKKVNLTPAQVSKKVFGNQERISDLKTGRSFIAPDTYETASKRLDGLERTADEGVAA